MKTILIVDDHEIVRSGLKMLINGFYPFVELQEAHNEESTVEILKKQQFDLVILDMHMPNSNSIGLLEYIGKMFPATKVLIFSMGSEVLYAKRFLQAGAKGYLAKDSPMGEVKLAIETILEGGKYISKNLMDILVDDVTTNKSSNPFDQLSSREFQIASFLLDGLSLTEISTLLNLQPSTVGTYKGRIFEKLKVSNLIELIDMANVYHIR
jgi:two-component system invasion response regulator UvrY